MGGRLSVCLCVFPPDKRKRDLDNLLKISIDSLQKAGFFHDDSQIDSLEVHRFEVFPEGKIEVSIRDWER